MCDTSGPDTGAALCLSAIGQQDTYLLGGESPFKYETKRHSEFRKFHRNYPVYKPVTQPGWPFDRTIKVTLNPRDMGDLLCNMYIRIELPGLSSTDYNYADRVGRHLFKTIKMRADETILEVYRDDIGFIYDEMYVDQSESISRIYTDGRLIYRETVLSKEFSDISNSKSVVYVPIPFFFSRSYESSDYETNIQNRPYFPLCAMHKQKLQFEIEFRPQSFFTNESEPLSLNTFDIVTEEITLTPEERIFYTSQRHEMVTDVFMTHPKSETFIGNNLIRLELSPENRVKTFHFFFRQKVFENENIASNTLATDQIYHYYHNRFNLTPYPSYRRAIDSISDDTAINTRFYINSQAIPAINIPDSKYYRYVIPLNCKFHSTPRNIYTYSFSMNPRNVEPSGSLDFSTIKNNRTVLEMDLNPFVGTQNEYTFHMYYTAYQTFLFENGYVTLVGTYKYESAVAEYEKSCYDDLVYESFVK